MALLQLRLGALQSKVAPLSQNRESRSLNHSAFRNRPVCQAGKPTKTEARTSDKVTGIVFEPFNEVKDELVHVSEAKATESYARTEYHSECEAAINEQINIEYNISYVYHSLYAYFDRDNVGLPGFAKHFKDSSDDERHHAELLMAFQNTRGGHVKLQSILMPEVEYDNAEKGEALYAMELALSLEKLNFMKLRHLHDIACKHNDAQMADFIEGELLAEQAKDVKKAAEYVSQLRRVGKGLGVFYFDRQLSEELAA